MIQSMVIVCLVAFILGYLLRSSGDEPSEFAIGLWVLAFLVYTGAVINETYTTGDIMPEIIRIRDAHWILRLFAASIIVSVFNIASAAVGLVVGAFVAFIITATGNGARRVWDFIRPARGNRH